MATVNKALKKRAQAFAAEHGLSYLKALHAVDEPLHGLRDFLYESKVRAGDFGVKLQFRLHGEQGIFTDAFSAERRFIPGEWSAALKGEAQNHPAAMPPVHTSIIARGVDLEKQIRDARGYPTMKEEDLLIEMGTRFSLLRTHSAADIWELRALQRAGVIDGSVDLSLKRHYYGTELKRPYLPAMKHGGKLGIFTVAMGCYTDIQTGKYRIIPILPQELDALFAGGPAVEIDPSAVQRGLPKINEIRNYPKGLLAYRAKKCNPLHAQHNSITVLLRPGMDLAAGLKPHGLDPMGFELEDQWFDLERPAWVKRDTLSIILGYADGDSDEHSMRLSGNLSTIIID